MTLRIIAICIAIVYSVFFWYYMNLICIWIFGSLHNFLFFFLLTSVFNSTEFFVSEIILQCSHSNLDLDIVIMVFILSLSLLGISKNNLIFLTLQYICLFVMLFQEQLCYQQPQ